MERLIKQPATLLHGTGHALRPAAAVFPENICFDNSIDTIAGGVFRKDARIIPMRHSVATDQADILRPALVELHGVTQAACPARTATEIRVPFVSAEQNECWMRDEQHDRQTENYRLRALHLPEPRADGYFFGRCGEKHSSSGLVVQTPKKTKE
jgi:hypothetical protein